MERLQDSNLSAALDIVPFNGEEQSAKINRMVEENAAMVDGEQWIAGDHAMFAFQGIPCIAVTSSNLMETVLDLTHTAGDTIDQLDFGLIDETAGVIAKIVRLSAPS